MYSTCRGLCYAWSCDHDFFSVRWLPFPGWFQQCGDFLFSEQYTSLPTPYRFFSTFRLFVAPNCLRKRSNWAWGSATECEKAEPKVGTSDTHRQKVGTFDTLSTRNAYSCKGFRHLQKIYKRLQKILISLVFPSFSKNKFFQKEAKNQKIRIKPFFLILRSDRSEPA